MANTQRMNNSSNQLLKRSIIADLEAVIRKINNPYATLYRTLHEIELQEQERATSKNEKYP
jgi:hypothetical protein